MQVLPGSVITPDPEVVVDRLPAREVVRECPPRTAIAHDVEDRIDDLAALDTGGTTASLGFGNLWFDPVPLGIGQVGGVSFSCRPGMLPDQPLLRQALRTPLHRGSRTDRDGF